MIGLSRLKTLSLAVVLALASGVGAAQASTVTATCGTDSRTYSLSGDDSSVSALDCYATGMIPNFWDDSLDAQLASDGYSKTGSIGRTGGKGDNSAYSDMLSLIGGSGGDFDLDQSVDVVLLFEMRPSFCGPMTPCQPIYAAFSLTTTTAAALEWSVTGPGRGLGHVTIYTKIAPVPLPAAGLMLVGALGGLGLIRRRRKAA